MTVRTRFAPSPTGVLHLGSIRTALFCWLFARRHEGQFVLRVEDTDRERSTKANVNAILDGLDWLGLHPDEGPFFQTDRFDRYAEVRDRWLDEGQAYHCYCTKEELDALRAEQRANGDPIRYDGRCRNRKTPREGVPPVVRFRNPTEGTVTVVDKVRGTVNFENAQLDDLIIARSDGTPTYNFTVVVDDIDMRISHVIRGDDHLNNTPRQINMFRALGVEPPTFAHLPMILGPDGTKLSKRHGAVDIRDYREHGYLRDAILNYLVRLGWAHGDQEIFSKEEMIRLFDIADVNHSASAFNPEKLVWLNQQYIIATPAEELGIALLPFLERAGLEVSNGPAPAEVAEVYRERAETLEQMAESSRYCYEEFESIDPSAAKKYLRPVILEPLRAVTDALGRLDVWDRANIEECIRNTADSCGINMGKLGQPIRVASTGGAVSPPLDATLSLIGQDRTVRRLQKADEFIVARAAAAGN